MRLSLLDLMQQPLMQSARVLTKPLQNASPTLPNALGQLQDKVPLHTWGTQEVGAPEGAPEGAEVLSALPALPALDTPGAFAAFGTVRDFADFVAANEVGAKTAAPPSRMSEIAVKWRLVVNFMTGSGWLIGVVSNYFGTE